MKPLKNGVNVRGKYRIKQLADGIYVTGPGYSEKVLDYLEALDVITELNELERKRHDRVRIEDVA